LVTVAVNVTLLPWHEGFSDAVSVTDNGRLGFTVMVMVLDIAVSGVAQFRLDTTWHVTTSPFNGVYW